MSLAVCFKSYATPQGQRTFVVKIQPFADNQDLNIKMKEAATLARLPTSPHALRIEDFFISNDYFEDSSAFVIVTNFCSGGNPA